MEGQLTLSYQRLRTPQEIDYVVEVSGDLKTWHSGPQHIFEPLQPDELTILARRLAPAG